MTRRPNILLIQADQHRYDCTGYSGHPLLRTPHLDQLAADGVRFTHAFTPCPTCCPSRQSLLCGQWPHAHGGLWNYSTGVPVPLFDQPTWTEALAASGYSLGYVGHWGVHPTRSPLEFGFGEALDGHDYAVWRKAQSLPDPRPDNLTRSALGNKPVARWFGGIDPVPVEQTRTHWYADQVIAMIRRYHAEGQPWHIRLDFEQPHLPCFPAEPFASLYPPETIAPWGDFDETFAGKPYIQRQQLASWDIEELTWREWSVFLSHYLGMVSQIDDAVGRVLAALDELGLADSTLVVYTSDHGDNCGSHRLIDKHYVMYDNVVRVPLLLRWPEAFAAGSTRDEFVSHAIDLAATMCDVTGLPIPDTYAGRSLLPLCRGEQAADWRDDILVAYNGAQFGLFMQRMIRDRRYKYVWNPTDVDELYDLQADPHELHNLVEHPAHAEALADLRQRLLDQLAAQGDALVANEWTRRQLAEGKKVVR